MGDLGKTEAAGDAWFLGEDKSERRRRETEDGIRKYRTGVASKSIMV
jgi:hypothetical protein